MKSLEDIKAGDNVWVGRTRDRRDRLRTVEEVTLEHIVLTTGDRYHRDNLRSLGLSDLYQFITAVEGEPAGQG